MRRGDSKKWLITREQPYVSGVRASGGNIDVLAGKMRIDPWCRLLVDGFNIRFVKTGWPPPVLRHTSAAACNPIARIHLTTKTPALKKLVKALISFPQNVILCPAIERRRCGLVLTMKRHCVSYKLENRRLKHLSIMLSRSFHPSWQGVMPT